MKERDYCTPSLQDALKEGRGSEGADMVQLGFGDAI